MGERDVIRTREKRAEVDRSVQFTFEFKFQILAQY
jgi:hypothetical protein